MNEAKTISWEVKHAGPIRPYADSVYEFEITTNIPERQAKEFCTKFLRPSQNESPGGKYTGACSFPFGLSSYFRFTKITDGKYHYIVCQPYTG